MLKALQKALGVQPKAEEVAGPAVEAAVAELSATLDATRAEFDEFKQTAEALLVAADAEKAELVAKLEEANAKLAAAADVLASAEADKEAAEAAALAAKLNARKEKVLAAVGTERADALLQVTEEMDDAAFDAVLSAIGLGAKAEAESQMFNEVGVAAEADAAKVVDESPEMKILKKKYAKK